MNHSAGVPSDAKHVSWTDAKNYFNRFWPPFLRDWRKAIVQQLLVSFVLAILIFIGQVAAGLIVPPAIRANLWTIFWPYLLVLLGLTLYHAVRTVVELDGDRRTEIRRLQGVIEEAATGRREQSASEPNLKPEKPELSTLYLDDETWYQFPGTHAAAAREAMAVLIPIRNEPRQQGRKIREAENVKARLVWYVDGHEKCQAYPAAWVGERSNTVTIGAESKRLIIAVAAADSRNNDWLAIINNMDLYNVPRTILTFDEPPQVAKAGKGRMELQIIQDRPSGEIETLNTFVYHWYFQNGRPQLIPT